MTQPSKAAKDAWLARNLHKRPSINKSNRLRVYYGITLEQHRQMYEDQAGTCAICHVEFGTRKGSLPHVDHDHATRWVRGLLCNNCNCAIGLLGEDIDRLQSAIEYLISNPTPPEFIFTPIRYRQGR